MATETFCDYCGKNIADNHIPKSTEDIFRHFIGAFLPEEIVIRKDICDKCLKRIRTALDKEVEKIKEESEND